MDRYWIGDFRCKALELVHIENEYEAQQLNDFYNQENEEKKKKLEEIRNNYYSQQTVLKIKLKEKYTCNS